MIFKLNIIYKNIQAIQFHVTQEITFKGVVHFLKKTFADNLLTPMLSKLSTSFFFSRKEIFLHINFFPYNGLQWEPNGSSSK